MKRFTTTLLFSGLIILNIFSQESNNELLKKLVEKNILTQAEAEEISSGEIQEEKKSSFGQSIRKIREGLNTPYLQFGGYGLLTYKYNERNDVRHDMNARVVFLSMSGKLTDNLGYYILFDFANPKLYEYYAEWKPSAKFNLRGGQFKIPISFENQLSLTVLETIYNTRSVSSLIGMDGDPIQYSKDEKAINHTGRDFGIQASGALVNNGEYDVLLYSVGLFQGTGLGVKENNNTKDLAASIIYQPIKGLRIAGGIYAGQANYTIGDPEKDPKEDHVRNRALISTDYKCDRFYSRAEYIYANDGGTIKEGLHGTALYYIVPQKINILGKIDYYNANKKNNTEVMDYTLGVNYYFWKNCRFQLNYMYTDYSKNFSLYSSDNTVHAQMQIVF